MGLAALDRRKKDIMGLCSVYRLTVSSFALGGLTVVFFALSISTDWWLTTREEHIPSYMVGAELPPNITVQAIWMRVWAGLWRFCVISENYPEFVNCLAVSYKVENTGRGEDRTLTSITIVAAARRAVALPVTALILSIIAVVFIGVGNIRKDCRTLLGGVCFILSGLSLAVGMIIYISTVNDEVAFRVDTERHGAGFSYAYGWSFFVAGFGFLSSELAAVICISLFLRRNSGLDGMSKIIPGLEEKILDSSRSSNDDDEDDAEDVDDMKMGDDNMVVNTGYWTRDERDGEWRSDLLCRRM